MARTHGLATDLTVQIQQLRHSVVAVHFLPRLLIDNTMWSPRPGTRRLQSHNAYQPEAGTSAVLTCRG